MATLTSVKSGYWNDPTVWNLGVVPADGDTVTVATGHTVTFNVDQSTFANGLAGLTINGTLQIPSQATDPSIPNTVVLKVNANIAGSGSFLIGSSTSPITYPQLVQILINGTITTATVQFYGEIRTPFYDWLAQAASAGATTLVLQNGLPLRANDQIALGVGNVRGFPSISDWYYTVQSYDATTKTVTLTSAITTARPLPCLVVLTTRSVQVRAYGTVNVPLINSPTSILQGVQCDKNDKSADYTGRGQSFTNCTFQNSISSGSDVSANTATDCACVRIQGPISVLNLSNIVLLGSSKTGGFYGVSTATGCIAQNMEKFANFGCAAQISNCSIYNVYSVCSWAREGRMDNCFIDWVNNVLDNWSYFAFTNVTFGPNVSVIISTANRPVDGFFKNITLQGTGTRLMESLVYSGTRFYNVKGNVPAAPPPYAYSSASAPYKHFVFLDMVGFNDDMRAYRRWYRHGFVSNRFTASPPDYNTFDFQATETPIKPLAVEWEIAAQANQTIIIQGNVVALGTGEKVTVQIFSRGKEPFVGDTPEFSQTYTATGAINVSYTVTSSGPYIVRIFAEPNQTTNPVSVTVNTLGISGGTGGGTGGGTPPPTPAPPKGHIIPDWFAWFETFDAGR